MESRLGSDVWTLPAILQRRSQLSNAAPAQWELTAKKTWKATSWLEYRDAALRVAVNLRQLGFSPGDRVGIMAPSSRYWDILQMGVLTARGVIVGLDPHDREDNLNAMVQCCDLAGLILHDPAWLSRFGKDVRSRLRFVVSLQPTQEQGVVLLDHLLYGGGCHTESGLPAAQPDDPATIIFTSGTTGAPKGIQYTHRQICLGVQSIMEVFPDISADSRLVCWLPLSNLFQRIINICAIGWGAQTYYLEDPRLIMRHIRHIEPYLFIGVPRFYEKLYADVMKKIDQAPAWHQRLTALALSTGERHANVLRSGGVPGLMESARYRLADWLVLRRLRGVMGTRLRYMVSGSAPFPGWLLERLQAMGLLVLESYGLSENVIPVATNRPEAYRFGTVGRVMRGNELRLAEDGELWVRGPGVFGGYYGQEGEKGLFDTNGYLATGDYASIDTDGFITLTGRKSEIFKTSTGRRIAPAGIESLLLQISYIEQAAVFGAERPFLIAVLTVNKEISRGGEMTQPGWKALCDCVRRDVTSSLASLAAYQRPAGVVITTQPFSIERGELTPNLKLRRASIEAAYHGFVEELYSLLMATDGAAVQMERDEGQVILCSL